MKRLNNFKMLQPQISNFVHINELLFCILAKVIVNSRLFHPKFKILVKCCKQCITLPDAARGPLIWCCTVCQYPIKQTLCVHGLTHTKCMRCLQLFTNLFICCLLSLIVLILLSCQPRVTVTHYFVYDCLVTLVCTLHLS